MYSAENNFKCITQVTVDRMDLMGHHCSGMDIVHHTPEDPHSRGEVNGIAKELVGTDWVFREFNRR